MLGYDPSNDQQPVTWWRGHAIHAAMLLVIVHVAAMLATAFAMAFGLGGLLSLLPFSSITVMRGALWQFVTYAFVHPPDRLLWFAIEMYLLWSFGRELERFFGRRAFLQLYAILLILNPVVLTLIGFVTPTALFGSGSLHFAIFIAFAALYPGAAMLFGITAKWAAVILVGINTIQGLAYHAWSELIALWISVGVAWAWVNWQRGALTLPSLDLFKRKPKFRVVRSEPTDFSSSTRSSAGPELDEIDPLLDKIARSGINSLTSAERARLEKARAALLKKDSGSN